MVFWNISNFLRGKEEPSSELKAIEELRKELSARFEAMDKRIERISKPIEIKKKQKNR
jgi:hypothetical protein